MKLKYLKIYRDCRGKTRYYLRRKGRQDVPLPDITSPEFMAAYGAALNNSVPAEIGRRRVQSGSLEFLIIQWQKSDEYLSLKKSTQAVYNRLLQRIRTDPVGQGPFAEMEAHHARAVINALGDAPTTRTRIRRLLSQLMQFAISKGWREDDPTASVKVKRQKSEGIHAWTDAEIEQYLQKWPRGTQQRLALSLMLYTGQRRSDVVRMGPSDVQENMIYVRQEKTSECLWIPIHSALQDELLAWTGTGQTYLSRVSDGKPYGVNGFYNVFKDWCAAADLPLRCSPHGLRKAAGRRLAEAGCTPHQIAAILGHRSLTEVMRYTRSVEQRKMAIEAMAKFEKVSNAKNTSV